MRVAPEGRLCSKKHRRQQPRVTATAGIPCTMVLTVSFVLSSVTMLGCHRHQWNRFTNLAPAFGAPGPHDFAVRTTTVRRAIMRSACASIASHSHVRDDREAPLYGERDKRNEALIWGEINARDRDRLARRAKSAYRP